MSNANVKELDNVTLVPGLGWNATGGPDALLLSINAWTVPVNGYISPVLVLFTLTTNAVVCAVLLRPGAVQRSCFLWSNNNFVDSTLYLKVTNIDPLHLQQVAYKLHSKFTQL